MIGSCVADAGDDVPAIPTPPLTPPPELPKGDPAVWIGGAGVVACPPVPVLDVDGGEEEEFKEVDDDNLVRDDKEDDDDGVEVKGGGTAPSAAAPVVPVLAEILREALPLI